MNLFSSSASASPANPRLPWGANPDERGNENAGNKNAFTRTKRRMKASHGPRQNRLSGWPHPSHCGEVSPPPGADRRVPSNGYPDSGLETSLPPSRQHLPSRQWLVGVCNPLQWRNRRRFSRRSLHLMATKWRTRARRFQRASCWYVPATELPSRKTRNFLRRAISRE